MAKTYLTPELPVCSGIAVMAKSLLQESEQNGDNDASLQSLAETNEED